MTLSNSISLKRKSVLDIDRSLRIVFIGILFAVVYTLSKPLTLSILAAFGVLIIIVRFRQLRDEESKSAQ
jgi:hypothetical protein